QEGTGEATTPQWEFPLSPPIQRLTTGGLATYGEFEFAELYQFM
ncbi:5184_t:CDS:2, partial [Funneliformis mosseae]